MADPGESHSLGDLPDRASLRRALRTAIEAALPQVRIVAEGFLAEVSPIDLLGVGDEGELISIRIAGTDGDAAALVRALADLSWLRPRKADLGKLAPGLGIEPSAEPRVILVAREFGTETRAAAGNFPTATVQLWRWQSDAADRRPDLRIESVATGLAAEPRDPRPETASIAQTAPSRASSPGSLAPEPSDSARLPRPSREPLERRAPLTAPPSPSAFRTGLVETDLEPEQRADPGARPGHRSTPVITSRA